MGEGRYKPHRGSTHFNRNNNTTHGQKRLRPTASSNRSNHHHSSHHGNDQHHEEEYVDDLMVAASYATGALTIPTLSSSLAVQTNLHAASAKIFTNDDEKEPDSDECGCSSDEAEDEDDTVARDKDCDEIDLDSVESVTKVTDEPDGTTQSNDLKSIVNDEANATTKVATIASISLTHEGSECDNASSKYDDDDDDNESDVDLVEQLAKMIQGGDDDDENDDEVEFDNNDNNAKTIQLRKDIPKTANEIDGYHDDLKQIESVLQWSLQVTCANPSISKLQTKVDHTKDSNSNGVDGKILTTSSSSVASEFNMSSFVLHPAGKLLHYIVEDRTVIVESNSSTGVNNNESGVILDEGTVLFFKKIPHTGSSTCDSSTEVIALGKILEVFGPIRQPLYSIRLPPSPSSYNRQQTKQPMEMKVKKHKNNKKRHYQKNSDLDEAKKAQMGPKEYAEVETSCNTVTELSTDTKSLQEVDESDVPLVSASSIEKSNNININHPTNTFIDSKSEVPTVSVETGPISLSTTASATEETSKADCVQIGTKAAPAGNNCDSGSVTVVEAETLSTTRLALDSCTTTNPTTSNAVDEVVTESSPALHNGTIMSGENEKIPKDDDEDYSVSDPWERNGEYASYILSQQKMKIPVTVYYVNTNTAMQTTDAVIADDVVGRILDTASILRNNRRGCDASNVYDEEVSNVYEMDFSDDEQERASKNKKSHVATTSNSSVASSSHNTLEGSIVGSSHSYHHPSSTTISNRFGRNTDKSHQGRRPHHGRGFSNNIHESGQSDHRRHHHHQQSGPTYNYSSAPGHIAALNNSSTTWTPHPQSIQPIIQHLPQQQLLHQHPSYYAMPNVMMNHSTVLPAMYPMYYDSNGNPFVPMYLTNAPTQQQQQPPPPPPPPPPRSTTNSQSIMSTAASPGHPLPVLHQVIPPNQVETEQEPDTIYYDY